MLYHLGSFADSLDLNTSLSLKIVKPSLSIITHSPAISIDVRVSGPIVWFPVSALATAVGGNNAVVNISTASVIFSLRVGGWEGAETVLVAVLYLSIFKINSYFLLRPTASEIERELAIASLAAPIVIGPTIPSADTPKFLLFVIIFKLLYYLFWIYSPHLSFLRV